MAFDFGGRRLDDEDAMLAALLELHRRKQERARPRDLGSNYERILKHFERRGERLRGERLITAELTERLLRGTATLPPPRLQQEMEITGTPGQTAAGRVRITNRSSVQAQFEIVIGRPLDGSECPSIDFEPRRSELGPGESCLLRVAVNLAGWKSGRSVTIPVECRWGAGFDRLWLVVSIPSAQGRAR